MSRHNFIISILQKLKRLFKISQNDCITTFPFLVEKSTGRVVAFASAMSLENNIKLYENGTMTPSLYSYCYPEEDRFDYK